MSKRAMRRGFRAVGAGVRFYEPLESRQLMSVTVASPLGNVIGAYTDPNATISLANVFQTTNINGTVVQFVMQAGTNVPTSNVNILLYDQATATRSAAPVTVANFLSYVNSGAYTDSFIHRALNFSDNTKPAQFLQGGGYDITGYGTSNAAVGTIPTNAPINLEYASDRPNSAMTIAMARTSDPNSATSGFFFNTQDNTSVFNDSNQYAVFGQVIGAASQAALTTYSGYTRIDATGGNSNSPYGDLPVVNASAGATFSNLVYVRSASVLSNASSMFTYSVADSNSSVASATVDANNNLVLHYLSPGTTTFTVTGADLTGATASTSFTVTLSGPAPVTLGTGTSTLVYTDSDGTKTTYRYAGPGTASFVFNGAGVPVTTGTTVTVPAAAGQTLSLSSISIGGASSAKSSLTAVTVGGSVPGSVVSALSAGAIGKISLPGVTVGSGLNLYGGVGSLTIAGVAGGTANAVTTTAGSTLSLGGLSGESMTITGTVKSLTIAGSSNATVALTGSTASLSVPGGLQGSSLTVSTSAGTVAVGALTGSSIAVTGGAGNLSVKGAITNSSLSVGAAAKAFAATGAIAGSTVTLTGATTFSAPVLSNSTVSVGGGVKSLTVPGALTNSTVNLANVAAVTVGPMSGSSIYGSSADTVTVKGAIVSGSVGFSGNVLAFAAGSLNGSDIEIGGGIRTATISGAVSNGSTIHATGPLLTFKADSLLNSTLAVGVSQPPTAVTDFGSQSYIGTLTLGNKSLSLSGSYIYAKDIVTLNLGHISSAATQSTVIVDAANSLTVANPAGKTFSTKKIGTGNITNVVTGITSAGLSAYLSLSAL